MITNETILSKRLNDTLENPKRPQNHICKTIQTRTLQA